MMETTLLIALRLVSELAQSSRNVVLVYDQFRLNMPIQDHRGIRIVVYAYAYE